MGHGPMKLQHLKKAITFRDVDLTVDVTAHVCPVCNTTASDIKSTGHVQRQIADAYRRKMNLLTSDEIRTLRKAKNLAQEALADLLGVGVASIERWELGNIQSNSMDKLLRTFLGGNYDCSMDVYTGNRSFSMPRIKLIALQFESITGKRLLLKGDKFLFLSKYLWYADMDAFRDLAHGMTGASYAALPNGPQLNNYKDLVSEIKDSDESSAEPLSKEELLIIQSIAEKFPNEQQVYNAAHREVIFQEAPTGTMISYTLAARLTEI